MKEKNTRSARDFSPVCIAGMHRSGTSMVTRLLYENGLYLGPESDLMQAHTDNPEGYWENIKFVSLNDRILDRVGGAWDVVPSLQKGWETDPGLSDLRDEAMTLIRIFEGERLWGWKDPRSSLTIRFWKSLIPDLKVVICLRNPVEVAQSLTRRGSSSPLFGLKLWFSYNRELVQALSVKERIVTHYDASFINPDAEIRRLLNWLGVPIEEDEVLKACATIKSSLRHNRSRALVLRNSLSGISVLYNNLESESGEVYQGPAKTEQSPDDIMKEAQKTLQAGELDRSEALFRNLLEKDSQNSEALQSLGLISFQRGNKERAAEFFLKALVAKPDDFTTHNNLGVIYYEMGRLEEAKSCYAMAIGLKRDYAEAIYNRGVLYQKEGEKEHAVNYFKKALELKPGYSEAQRSLKELTSIV